MIVTGVCVGTWEKFNKNVVPAGLGPIHAVSAQTSIAFAYNMIIDNCIEYGGGLEALILQHDDLRITDPMPIAKIRAAFADPTVGLLGVAGGGGASLDWWNQEPIGHQNTDVMNIDFGAREGEVELLEGSFLVLSPNVVEQCYFDTRFPGFHGYDEFAQSVRKRGFKVRVIDLDTHHHTQMGFKSPESEKQWQDANRQYQEKWGNR